MIYKNNQNHLIECHQWDGTQPNLAVILGSFSEILAATRGEEPCYKILQSGGMIGELVKDEWVTQNLSTGQFRIMTSKQISEELTFMTSGEHKGIAYWDLWSDLDATVTELREYVDDLTLAKDRSTVRPNMIHKILCAKAQADTLLKKLEEEEKEDYGTRTARDFV